MHNRISHRLKRFISLVTAFAFLSVFFLHSTKAYAASLSVPINVRQVITINSPYAKPQDSFDYELKAESKDGNLPEGAKDGIYKFSLKGDEEKQINIEYTKPGEYTYQIYQLASKEIKNVSQDKSVYTVVIRIVEKDGALYKEITIKSNDKKGEEITIVDAPIREGYRFDYWEGSVYHPGDKYVVTEDHTFVAQWIKEGQAGGPNKNKEAVDKIESAINNAGNLAVKESGGLLELNGAVLREAWSVLNAHRKGSLSEEQIAGFEARLNALDADYESKKEEFKTQVLGEVKKSLEDLQENPHAPSSLITLQNSIENMKHNPSLFGIGAIKAYEGEYKAHQERFNQESKRKNDILKGFGEVKTREDYERIKKLYEKALDEKIIVEHDLFVNKQKESLDRIEKAEREELKEAIEKASSKKDLEKSKKLLDAALANKIINPDQEKSYKEKLKALEEKLSKNKKEEKPKADGKKENQDKPKTDGKKENKKESTVETIKARLQKLKIKYQSLLFIKDNLPKTYNKYMDIIDKALEKASQAIKVAEDYLAMQK